MKIRQYSLLTPAVSPALDLETVKEHLKISGSDYDSQLLRLISVVTDYAEAVTGRDLITKTWKGYLDQFPCDYDSLQVRRSKLQSITSIQYYLNDVLTTLSSSDYYFTDCQDYSQIVLKNNKSWPQNDCRKQAIVITFVSGYGDDDCNIPSLLKQAMMSHLTTLFENAGDCADSSSQFRSLYTPYIIPDSLLRIV